MKEPYVSTEYTEYTKRLMEMEDLTKPLVDMSSPEPAPSPEDASKPAVWDLVMQDMRERDEAGRAKYGTPLQPHNGRKSLIDAYQEALDLAVYLRQEIFERLGK